MLRRFACAVLFVNTLCLPITGQAPANVDKTQTQNVDLINTLTIDSLQKRIQGMGFECTRDKDSSGKDDTYFVFRAQGYKVAALVPAPTIVELDNIFTDVHPSLETINEWNRNHRFTRVYIDSDGTVILQDSLNLSGGVTRGGFEAFIANFRDDVANWATFVLQHEPKK